MTKSKCLGNINHNYTERSRDYNLPEQDSKQNKAENYATDVWFVYMAHIILQDNAKVDNCSNGSPCGVCS